MVAAKKAAEPVTKESPAPAPAPVMGYKVVGKHAVFGVEPGGFVELAGDALRLHLGAGSVALTEKEA